MRQHILQSHKGCGARLLDRTESCGELIGNIFWLCNQCVAEYEVTFSNFCITWTNRSSSSSSHFKVNSARRQRSQVQDSMTEVQRNGALDLSVRFEELAPSLGLGPNNKVQYVRDSLIGDLSLGLASIQDPRGPLRTHEEDFVADAIMERASDWTTPNRLLMALLQRLIYEMVLPFANQVIMSCLRPVCPTFIDVIIKQTQKWTMFLMNNKLADVDFLFKMLIFWSRNIWRRSKISEENCVAIRSAICSLISVYNFKRNLINRIEYNII
jgi:hypothetical protein